MTATDLGDLSHLSPADRQLYAALYAERNRVDAGELELVRAARHADRLAPVATKALACSYVQSLSRGKRAA